MNEKERRLSSKCDFDILEVIEKCKDDTDPNNFAWCILLSSMTPFEWPSAKKHIRKGNVENSIYPITMDECEEMRERLELAEQSQKTSDEKFSAILNEMKSIVEWSKKKHFTCSGFLVACFLVFVSLLGGAFSTKEAEKWEMNLNCVNSWDDKDTTLTLEESYHFKYPENECLNSPTIAKYYYLYDIAKQIYWDSIKVDVGTDEEEITQARIRLEENLNEFNRRSAMTTREIKNELIDYYESKISEAKIPSNITRTMLILLSVLYLFSCNQYGYNISRFHRSKGAKNSLFYFSSIYFMSILLSKTNYSRRITQEEANSEAKVKFGFLFLGLILMVLFSSVILIISTFNGIYYNYIEPWKNIHGDKVYIIDNKDLGTARYYIKNIANVISRGYINMFTFEGRDNRLQYLFFFAANTFLLVLLIHVAGVNYYIIPFALVFLAALVSTTVKRIHDIGKTGKYALLYFFPSLAIIGSVILLFYKGNKEDNEYGEVPENVF